MYIASVFIISEFFVVHKSGLQQEIFPSLFETCRNDNLVEMEGHIALLKSFKSCKYFTHEYHACCKREYFQVSCHQLTVEHIMSTSYVSASNKSIFLQLRSHSNNCNDNEQKTINFLGGDKNSLSHSTDPR